jgi:hypothetical protein
MSKYGETGQPDQGKHDVLVIPPDGVLHRMRVNKKGTPAYTKRPDRPLRDNAGYRKVMAIAQGTISTSGEPVSDEPAGAGFAVMPVKPEPTTSSMTCFLINQNNLSIENDWTSAEWNDEPSGEAQQALAWSPDEFDAYLAGPQGKVFWVHRQGGKTTIEELASLATESDVWGALRNGVIAGRVYSNALGKVVPLLNVTALLGRPAREKAAKGDE